MRKAYLLLLLFLLVFPAAAQQFEGATFHLYLIGDAGKSTVSQASYKKILQQQSNNDTVPSAIVFLGDNIYPKGMPEEGNKLRKRISKN